jgi:CO dehydrogenase/acetyl-CoA synthase delta subunit
MRLVFCFRSSSIRDCSFHGRSVLVDGKNGHEVIRINSWNIVTAMHCPYCQLDAYMMLRRHCHPSSMHVVTFDKQHSRQLKFQISLCCSTVCIRCK